MARIRIFDKLGDVIVTEQGSKVLTCQSTADTSYIEFTPEGASYPKCIETTFDYLIEGDASEMVTIKSDKESNV